MNTKTDRQTGRTLKSACRHCGEPITATITPSEKHTNGEAVTFAFLNGKLAGIQYSNHALPASMPCQLCNTPLGGSWEQWECVGRDAATIQAEIDAAPWPIIRLYNEREAVA